MQLAAIYILKLESPTTRPPDLSVLRHGATSAGEFISVRGCQVVIKLLSIHMIASEVV